MLADSVTQLRFDGSEDVAIHWAARSALEHALDLQQLEELYERALPYLQAYCYALTTKHDWVAEDIARVGSMDVAICLGRDEQFIVDDGEYSTPHVSRLVLPRHFSAFTDPELAQDWAAMFSNLVMTSTTDTVKPDIFQLGRAGLPLPLQNVIYLLQFLSPGLLVVRTVGEDDNGHPQISDCGLPPALWVGEHIEDLEDVFGTNLAVTLYRTADDNYSAVEDVCGKDDASSDTFSDSDSFESDEDWASWNHSKDDLSFDSAELEILQGANKGAHPKSDTIIEQQNGWHNADANPYYGGADFVDEGSTSYRHCDAACKFCGRCSDSFAERLTELLLRTAIAV